MFKTSTFAWIYFLRHYYFTAIIPSFYHSVFTNCKGIIMIWWGHYIINGTLMKLFDALINIWVVSHHINSTFAILNVPFFICKYHIDNKGRIITIFFFSNKDLFLNYKCDIKSFLCFSLIYITYFPPLDKSICSCSYIEITILNDYFNNTFM